MKMLPSYDRDNLPGTTVEGLVALVANDAWNGHNWDQATQAAVVTELARRFRAAWKDGYTTGFSDQTELTEGYGS